MSFHHSSNMHVDHLHLFVQDLKQSVDFYLNILGFQILDQSRDKVSLTANGEHALLTLEKPKGVQPKKRGRTGLYHFAILLPDRSDLADVLRHFLNTGYPLQGASDHLVSEAIYLADPEGNGIEIYIDRPVAEWSWEDGEVVMATDMLQTDKLFADYPVGNWRGLPAETIIGHIHLHVSELKEVRRFYTDGLGFDIANSKYGDQVLFVSAANYHHHIGLNTWAGAGAPVPEENSTGLAYYSLNLPDHQTLEKIIQQLRAIDAYLAEEDGNWCTKDPSGNKILLHTR